jgi:hypothetical protein
VTVGEAGDPAENARHRIHFVITSSV